jgi:hypothetical protein
VLNAVDALLQVVVDEAEEEPEAGIRLLVVCGARAKPWLQKRKDVELLPWEVPSWQPLTSTDEPYRYQADEVAARFFSEVCLGAEAPSALTAEQLYFGALRDGQLVLGLKPGLSLAAPGFNGLQYGTMLVLACLATGAHYVEVGASELGDGKIVLGGQVNILGVTPALRTLLLDLPDIPPSAALTLWFRDLVEDTDTRAWGRFGSLMARAKVPGINCWGNSAAGGSILFSPRCPNPIAAGSWVSPGLPCERVEPNGTTMPALADVALLSFNAKWVGEPGVRAGLQVAALGQPVVSHADGSDTWVTNLGSHRCGRVLPERHMEKLLLRSFPGTVRAAVLVALPTHGGSLRNRVVLLVYVWPGQGGTLPAGALLEMLQTEFGSERAPDKVEVLELNPLLVDPSEDDAVIDRAGCASQYTSGVVWEKARAAVFRQLAIVAREVVRIRASKARAHASKGDA